MKETSAQVGDLSKGIISICMCTNHHGIIDSIKKGLTLMWDKKKKQKSRIVDLWEILELVIS